MAKHDNVSIVPDGIGHASAPAALPGQFSYGGQAVIEGVMIRGRSAMAVAVRAPSGEILVWSDALAGSRLARRVGQWPLVRGAILLWDAMVLGVRALTFSATVGTPPDRREALEARRTNAGNAGRLLLDPPTWLLVSIAMLMAVGIFFALPLAVVGGVDRFIDSAVVSNLVEGLIRLGLLVGYVSAIGFLPDVRRVFAYHGAEHKAVHAWEAGDPLDVAHVRRHPLAHPRCGTGFMLLVVVLSTALFVLLGRPDFLVRISSRIVLVPLVAGCAYEVLRFGAAHAGNPLARIAQAPGLRLQKLTTREPDDRMLEVAIAALRRVLVTDGRIADDAPGEPNERRVAADGHPPPVATVAPEDQFEPVAAD